MAKKNEKSKTTRPTENGHYMGLYTGYDYHDGHYRLARSYVSDMEAIQSQYEGLSSMARAHNRFVADEYTRLATEKRMFWENVTNDLGLEPPSPEHQYQYKNGEVYKMPNEPSDTAERKVEG